MSTPKPLTCLFIFAHPDDESAGAGGTIASLSANGHTTIVISATDGYVSNAGIPRQTRRDEFKKACTILGATKYELLDFPDGEIGNRAASDELIKTIAERIDRYKPEVVVTFDHSGWYYHLDHIAVSLATSRAVQMASHKIDVFLFNIWDDVRKDTEYTYITTPSLSPTHYVSIKDYKQKKFAALKAHKSQLAWEYFNAKRNLFNEDREMFYVARGSTRAEEILKQLQFIPVSRDNHLCGCGGCCA